ncbi:hypothetical protein [Actomonas aquatica]|uniref:Uncharacterized protein n=1 Tax=Actomonas aquatica TaxID=2866162 RepID=A0ABZ1CDB4_9BACT|nr:hypothetical protein [Opitutus sp. WL0086]WRQ89401.1 hypothetical protein K1X11_008265 [Opitutus sp. WL0086]
MSQKITASDSNYTTLTEAVAGALDNKEDFLVSVNAAGKAVLYDGTFPAFGVMVSKLQAGETAVRVRILGKNGTVRIKQGGAIVPGVRVQGDPADGMVVTAAAGGRTLGIKLDRAGIGNGADGDVIEVADVVEGDTPVPSAVADGATVATVVTALKAQGIFIDP